MTQHQTLERAIELRAQCDYRGALALLVRAEDAATLIERSRLQEDVGDYEEAERDARQAVMRAKSTSASVRLAAVLRARRRPQAAEELLRDVLGVDARIERAAALEELARLDEADALLAGCEPDDPRGRLALRMGLGGVARARGQYAPTRTRCPTTRNSARSRPMAGAAAAAAAVAPLRRQTRDPHA